LQLSIFKGLSVGEKPNFDIFLKPIVNTLIKLEKGIIINEKIFSAFLLFGCYDKPARAAITNINSSYGYYGCLKCCQKGERVSSDIGKFFNYKSVSRF